MPGGKPPAKIDWNVVDEMLEAGCLGTEIAAVFGLNKATIYSRCERDKGIQFHEYTQQKRAKGDSVLRKVQYDLALEKDRGMLIWLGKQRLGQSDKQDMNVNTNLSDLGHWVKGQEGHSERQEEQIDSSEPSK